jgi:EAL domain-containing protein (putative c-di-GMP-specific phosphodiesterase class I)
MGGSLSTGPHLSLLSALDLIDGLADGQLHCVYQPILELGSGRIQAVEALLRWQHPDRGPLAPDTFLPHAQRSKLGPMVTAFVLKTATAEWCRWRDQGIGVCLAVNVPPAELLDDAVPRAVADLAADGFDPESLTLEVTERRIADVSAIGPALERLRSLGVRLSIDDFGTGDSSLARLHRLRFEEIKIDRSFVDQVAEPGPGRQIVRFATELGHSLGMDVVAEGVERADQLRPLLDLGVDRVQGFHTGRPVSAHTLTPRLVRT